MADGDGTDSLTVSHGWPFFRRRSRARHPIMIIAFRTWGNSSSNHLSSSVTLASFLAEICGRLSKPIFSMYGCIPLLQLSHRPSMTAARQFKCLDAKISFVTPHIGMSYRMASIDALLGKPRNVLRTHRELRRVLPDPADSPSLEGKVSAFSQLSFQIVSVSATRLPLTGDAGQRRFWFQSRGTVMEITTRTKSAYCHVPTTPDKH